MKKFLAALLLLGGLSQVGNTLAHGLLGGVPNATGPFSWSASTTTFKPINGVTYTGTEGRQLLGINPYGLNGSIPALLWATGNFGASSTVGPTSDANIFILNKPISQGGKWTLDTNLSNFCTIEGPAHCFHTMDVMTSITFSKDSSGNPVTETVPVAGPIYAAATSASCGSSLSPEYALSRNRTDNLWYGINITCQAGNPQLRSFSSVAHTDTVTGVQYAFGGGDPNGIFTGQLNPLCSGVPCAGANPITWNTSVSEWLTSTYPYGSGTYHCSSPRTMGFATLTGPDGVERVYASVCYLIYVRIDGPTPGTHSCNAQQVDIGTGCATRWQPYWLAQSANTGSANGMRGLTASPTEGVMLTGFEGPVSTTAASDEHLWNVPPLCPTASGPCAGHTGTGATKSCADYSAGIVTLSNPTCGTSELSVMSTPPTMAGAGGLTGMSQWGNAVFPYNSFVPFYDSSNVLKFYVPFSNQVSGPGGYQANLSVPPNSAWSYMYINSSAGPQTPINNPKWAEGTFLTRSTGTPGAYTLNVTPDLFTIPMNGARDVQPSPFNAECQFDSVTGHYFGCALYATGWDYDNGSPNQAYWCQPAGSACPSLTPPPPGVAPTLTTRNKSAWVARYGP